jgi:hypothetical protein
LGGFLFGSRRFPQVVFLQILKLGILLLAIIRDLLV